jgi:hypothetical protein
MVGHRLSFYQVIRSLMREHELRYLTNEIAGQIDRLMKEFVEAGGKETPEQLFDRVTSVLPVEKLNADTVRLRVEGYYYASEYIFKLLLQRGKTRNAIVQAAALRPLSHYHYLVGSREPFNLLLTRDDYLNDPSTALVKLKDDIIAIAKLILIPNK